MNVKFDIKVQLKIRTAIKALIADRDNLEHIMADNIKKGILDSIENTFRGTPAEYHAVLADVDNVVAMKKHLPQFETERREAFANITSRIDELVFEGSGFVDRATYDRVHDSLVEDVNSTMELLDAVNDAADLFVGLQTAAGGPVVRV